MSDSANLPVLLTVTEAAVIMRCGRRSVVRYINDGTLAATRPGGRRYLITPQAIEDWSRRGQTTASRPEPAPVRPLRPYKPRGPR